MDKSHFFEDAPIVSWITWLWRKVWGIKGEITLLPNTKLLTEPPRLPRFEIRRLASERSEKYSKFLNQYYIQRDYYNLNIPSGIIEKQLREGQWTGVEICNKYGYIIGLVFSLYAGSYKDAPMGLITWLCVKPDFRKQGITNILLRSVYALNQPTTIYWWRTDGWLKSPCPPIYTESRIVRRSKHIDYIKTIQPVDTEVFYNAWKEKNPEGIALFSSRISNPLLSIYEYRRTATEYVQVAFQPTFEYENRISNKTFYEIVGWVVSEGMRTINAAIYIEALLDNIHLGEWYEAPEAMPHLDSKGWGFVGKSSWSVLGLDPGTTRPILALNAA